MSKTVNNLQGEIWDEESDALLAETVLRNVRQGNTLASAFDEVERVTDGRRTVSACKFRWHTRLKEQYAAGYELAKEEGKKAKRSKRVNQGARFKDIMKNVLEEDVDKEITIDDIYILVKKFKEQEDKKSLEEKEKDKKIRSLETELRSLKNKNEELNDAISDYKEVLQIKERNHKKVLEALETLRTLGVAINMPEQEPNKYKMKKDGTVEKI